jgi:uncharacterized protein YodC (DUF2158 family)
MIMETTTKDEQFIPGEKVVLKSGSWPMTINSIKVYSDVITYKCVWHTKEGIPCEGEYTYGALMRA